MFTCSTHDYVMFFTTRGRTYRLKGYEVPEGSRNSKGMNIVNLLPLEAGEKVSAMIRVPEYDPDAFLCMVTRKASSSARASTLTATSARTALSR